MTREGKTFLCLSTVFALFALSLFAQEWATGDGEKYNAAGAIAFSPIEHASFVIATGDLSIFVDPVGEFSDFSRFRRPDIILVTHAHFDHFAPGLIRRLKGDDTVVVGPRPVIDALGFGDVLNNNETKMFKGVNVEAIPMYNTTPSRVRFHPRGQGNGYVITLSGQRIYVSGDTEDIPAMRALQNIDYAFICMNLPYTMTPEQAASAVLAFEPRVVFPYHYRGSGGMSDIGLFKKIVSEKSGTQVYFLRWY